MDSKSTVFIKTFEVLNYFSFLEMFYSKSDVIPVKQIGHVYPWAVSSATNILRVKIFLAAVIISRD